MVDALLFRGMAWPKVTAGWAAVRVVFADGSQEVAGVVELTASGRGRRWQTDRAQGWWRDLAELDIADPKSVSEFVRRRGDPLGNLSSTTPTDTAAWLTLKSQLRIAALAWEPANDQGVSRVTDDDERLVDATRFIRELTEETLGELTAAVNPRGGARLVFHALTLKAYLLGSAASGLSRRIAMRRCALCGSWFELSRIDARFCCPTCKANFHNKMMEHQYGVGASAAQSTGPENRKVASRVARARTRRSASAADA